MSIFYKIDQGTAVKKKQNIFSLIDEEKAGLPATEENIRKTASGIYDISAKEKAARQAEELKKIAATGTFRQDRPLKRYSREMLRNTLELGGLTLGATAGGLGANPYTPVIGAGLGYAGGKKLTDLLLTKRTPSVTDQGTNLTDIIQSIKETGGDIVEGTKQEMLGLGLGKVATSVVSKGAAPFIAAAERNKSPLSPRNRLLPEESRLEINPNLKSQLKAYDEAGLTPLPSELFPESRTLSILDSVLSYTPFSADVMFKKSVQRLDALNAKRFELVTKGGTPKQLEIVGNDIKKEATALISKYSQAKGTKLQNKVDEFIRKNSSWQDKVQEGRGFQEKLASNLSERQRAVKGAYKNFQDSIGEEADTLIPPSAETRKLVDGLLKTELAKPPKAQDNDAIQYLMPFSSFGEGGYNFESLKGTRTDLGEKIKKLLEANNKIPTNESRIYSALRASIGKDMDNFAAGLGDDAKSLYETAKGLSKETHTLYDKKLAKIMNLDPEDVLKKVVNNGEFSIIQDIKNAVGEEGLLPIRRAYFKKLFTEAEDANGIINPLKLKNKFKSLTEETQKALLTDDQIYAINKISDEGLFNKTHAGKMKTIDFLETITGEPGSGVVNFLFKPENRENIRLAKRLLSPQRMRDVEQQAIMKVLKETPQGNYLPLQASREFVKYNVPLRELLDQKTYKAVSDFITTGQNAKRVEQLAINASQTGQVVIGHGAMSRAIASIASGKSAQVGAALTTLGTPYLIAKIYTSTAARDLLTSSLKLSPNSPAAVKMFIQAVNLASDPLGIRD